MRKIVHFDIKDEYRQLQDTLFSWEDVEGKEDWEFIFFVADSYVRMHIIDEIEEFLLRNPVKSSKIREGRNEMYPLNDDSTIVCYANADERVPENILTVFMSE